MELDRGDVQGTVANEPVGQLVHSLRPVSSRGPGMPEDEYPATGRLIGPIEAWHSSLITIHDINIGPWFVCLFYYRNTYLVTYLLRPSQNLGARGHRDRVYARGPLKV